MITGPDNLFALPELGPLLRDELACAPVHAVRRPAGRALIVQACSANRVMSLDVRHLTAVRLHVDQKAFVGDVICEPDALPWEGDSFQLVLAQHVGDVLPVSSTLIDEFARVLAPAGTLLWFGLNPWSPWLAWLHWQARRGMPVPRAAHADDARRRMRSCQLAALAPDYFGTCWPQRSETFSGIHGSRMLAPLRTAYLIAASKQRAVLTPLRPRLVRERATIGSQLVAPSHRARA